MEGHLVRFHCRFVCLLTDVFTLVGLLWFCARLRGSCRLAGPRVPSCGFGCLWLCAAALARSLAQLPVRLPCALCGVLHWLLGSSGTHFPGWFGGPLTWRSAHMVAGPAAPGPHPLAHRCGDCWWCHDEVHCAQHPRPWGVEFRRPRQAADPLGVLSCRRALSPAVRIAVIGPFSARSHEAPCSWQLFFASFRNRETRKHLFGSLPQFFLVKAKSQRRWSVLTRFKNESSLLVKLPI